eukprot:1808656-Prorocentrum_lima.AAC.1
MLSKAVVAHALAEAGVDMLGSGLPRGGAWKTRQCLGECGPIPMPTHNRSINNASRHLTAKSP